VRAEKPRVAKKTESVPPKKAAATGQVRTQGSAETVPLPTSIGKAPTKTPEGEPKKAPENAGAWLQRIRGLAADGDFLGVRNQCREALKEDLSPVPREEVEQWLGKAHIELALTARAMPEKTLYVVERGDSVDRISRKTGATADLIAQSNNLRDPQRIRAGDRLSIYAGKFSLAVDKSRHELTLMANGELFKKYRVGLGKSGSTPSGTFVICDRIKEPPWWRDGREIPYTGKPDGENILGTRWMQLRATGNTPDLRGYGIHGTWDESSIGRSETRGCVRLSNRDVEEIFILVPVGTPVTIAD
jgi:LysM repeat protein